MNEEEIEYISNLLYNLFGISMDSIDLAKYIRLKANSKCAQKVSHHMLKSVLSCADYFSCFIFSSIRDKI